MDSIISFVDSSGTIQQVLPNVEGNEARCSNRGIYKSSLSFLKKADSLSSCKTCDVNFITCLNTFSVALL